MKVKIGPYENWFGPYQLAEKLMFWVPKKKDEHGFAHTADRVYRFGEWLAHGSIEPEPKVGEVYDMLHNERHYTWLYRFLSWIHSKQRRKVKVQIDPWDTWNMQDTLGYIIRPMLVKLKAEQHGAPYIDPKDCPPELQPAKLTKKEKDAGTTDSTHFERWDWVLDEIIFAFNTLPGGANENWEDEFFKGEYDWQWKKLEDGMSEMVEGPKHTAEVDWDGRKKVEERIQNGFALFGKYYQQLWD
jgi:hypothetical protein